MSRAGGARSSVSDATARTSHRARPLPNAGRRRSDARSEERTVVADAVQPPGVTGGVLTQPEPQASPTEPKKRGFWGRVFGGRRDDAPEAQPVPKPTTPRTR